MPFDISKEIIMAPKLLKQKQTCRYTFSKPALKGQNINICKVITLTKAHTLALYEAYNVQKVNDGLPMTYE